MNAAVKKIVTLLLDRELLPFHQKQSSMSVQPYPAILSIPYDIVITSYDYLKKDIASYEMMRFHYVILDEAQYIKNQYHLPILR